MFPSLPLTHICRLSRIGQSLLSALAMLLVLSSAAVYADDTDIYARPPFVSSSTPLFMLVLPYRPNSGATVCTKFINGDGGLACKNQLGTRKSEIWPHLVNLMCYAPHNRTATGAAGCGYDNATGLAVGVAPADNVVDQDDILRVVLITWITDPGLYGVRFGIVLSHNDASDTDTALTQRTVNSDGAMVFQGAVELQQADMPYNWNDGSNNARDILIKKLGELPQVAANGAHPFSPRESFFELYRYLTGGQVFFGDNGYLDFKDADQNTAKTAPETVFVSPNNPACAVQPCTTSTVNSYSAARYNLDAWGATALRNRDGNYWPTNGMGAAGALPSTFPAFGNSWDAAVCTGGSTTSTNASKSCLSCRNGEANCTAAQYQSPVDTGGCSKAFALVNWQQDSSDTSANAQIESVMGATLATGVNGTKQWLGWLYQNDINNSPEDGVQNLTTYFMAPGNKLAEANSIAALTGTANQSINLDTDASILLGSLESGFVQQLKSVYSSRLVVSTSFAAPAFVPDPANALDLQHTVYFSQFMADSEPLWVGNLKKYGLDANGKVVDANNNDVIEAFTDMYDHIVRQIKSTALSHWTSAADLPNPSMEEGAVPGTDGRAVRLGGAGQLIPGQRNSSALPINPISSLGINSGRDNAGSFGSTRMVFTQDASGAIVPLNASNTSAFAASLAVTAADVSGGGSLALLQQELAGWARGNEVLPDGLNDVADKWGTPRSWLHGAALHSQPVAVHYAVGGQVETRVFYGSQDGFLRQVRDAGPAKTAGGEVWGFMPSTLLGNLKFLKQTVSSENITGFDGSPLVWRQDNDGDGIIEPAIGEKAYLIAGLRRGGSAYYALDVSDPDQPPELKWQITPATPGFAALGMTFAKPLLITIDRGLGAEAALALSGGYNGGYLDANAVPQVRKGKDVYDAVGTNDSSGNTLYIVQPDNGNLIWNASQFVANGHPQMSDSIAAAPAAMDVNKDGVTDYLYAADTGGRVWRMALHAGMPATNWQTHLLANLGRHETPAIDADRRFFAEPVVAMRRDINNVDLVTIALASGDREHPLLSTQSTQNRVYLLKDYPAVTGTVGAVVTTSNLTNLTNNAFAGGTIQAYGDSWYVDLNDVGELATSQVEMLNDELFFMSYVPVSNYASCGNLQQGMGRRYAINLWTAQRSSHLFNTNSLPYDMIGEGTQGGLAVHSFLYNNSRHYLLMMGQGFSQLVEYDNDGDGIGDSLDADDDNDGVSDVLDVFPLDAAETLDTDADGTGNNADDDDDGDGVTDDIDTFPLDATESVDPDNDGIGSNADTDDDNDYVMDVQDGKPLNNTEWQDSDGDGTGNRSDADDDNDGVADASDAFPVDPSRSAGSLGVIRTHFGDMAKHQLGFSVKAAGDVDQDGYPDVIVGAPYTYENYYPDPEESIPLNNNGVAKILSGRTGAVLHVFKGDSPDDLFGFSVNAAGDVNQDGVVDLIVGAINDHNNGPYSGSATIFSGADGNVLRVLNGDSAGDQFGWTVGAAGDINHDGFADVFVGAPYDDNAGNESGSVKVFSGVNGAVLRVLNGSGPDSYLGLSVDNAGDVNQDGDADLLVVDQLLAAAQLYSGATAALLRELGCNCPAYPGGEGYVEADYNAAGLWVSPNTDAMKVSVAGDVNMDGYPDTVVSFPRGHIGWFNASLVKVFSGADGTVLHTWFGDAFSDEFGASVAAAGDVNADGFDDVIVGAWNDGNVGYMSGSARVFSGATGETLYTYNGGDSNDAFGYAVTGIGDIDQDGFDDVAVGAYQDEVAGLRSGSVVILNGGARWQDRDADGIKNDVDTDNDNDGVLDVADAFPYDATETTDTDGDGVGNNADAFPQHHWASVDVDLDGKPDSFTSRQQSSRFDGFESGGLETLSWVNLGDSNWVVQSGVVYEGLFAAQSGLCNSTTDSVLKFTHTLPVASNVSFAVKISHDTPFIRLHFFIDNTHQAHWNGITGWQSVQYPVSAGLHTFTWVCNTYSGVVMGQPPASEVDGAWIDNVQIGSSAVLLVEDTDDDNDNVVDWLDSQPLNPAVGEVNFPLDNPYRGAVIRDNSGVSP